jgi:hypothetical protein
MMQSVKKYRTRSSHSAVTKWQKDEPLETLIPKNQILIFKEQLSPLCISIFDTEQAQNYCVGSFVFVKSPIKCCRCYSVYIIYLYNVLNKELRRNKLAFT